MFQVATVSLSADAGQAHASLGTTQLGDLSGADLFALLERFRQLDAVQNLEAEPHLAITTPSGRFLIRTGQGKLYLYNARDSAEPYSELTPAEIITHLERHAIPHAPDPSLTDSTPPSAPSAPHRGIAAAILAAGLALNGYTLYSVFYVETVNVRPDVTLITDAAELKTRQFDVVGTFATGGQPGDRTIVVGADGRVAFSEIGSRNRVTDNADTYRIGRRAGKLCLTTIDSGVIDVLNIDTLVYYRDTYRRTK